MKFLKHSNRYELPADCDPNSDLAVFAIVGGNHYRLMRISVDQWAQIAKDANDVCGIPTMFAAFLGKDTVAVMMVYPKPDTDLEASGWYTPWIKPL